MIFVFATDAKLNYGTLSPVGKFATARSGLKTGVENGKFVLKQGKDYENWTVYPTKNPPWDHDLSVE